MNTIEKKEYNRIRKWLSDRKNWDVIEQQYDRWLMRRCREDEKDGIRKHPLTDLCLVSCYMFIKQMAELGYIHYDCYKIDFDCGEKKEMGNNHHFVKNTQTGEIIDLTADQYVELQNKIPYDRGEKCIPICSPVGPFLGYVENPLILREKQDMLKIEKEVSAYIMRKMGHNPKVGRNDPCTCGSGIKYKKCCGK